MAVLGNTQEEAVASPALKGSSASAVVKDVPSNDLPAFDDALLIRVKGKVKRPSKPDSTERDVVIAKLQGEVVKNSDRMKEIKTILDNRQKGQKAPLPPDQAELKKKCDDAKKEFQALLRQKQAIREELNAAIGNKNALRDEIRQLREKTPKGVNLEKLETILAECEYKLAHESLSEAEEKKMTLQVSALNAARPMAKQHAAAEARLKEVEEARASASKRLTEADNTLTAIRKQEDVDRAALKVLQEGDVAKGGAPSGPDYGALTVEKQECWQVISALRDKMTEIREAFDVEYKEYIKLDKNYNAWLRHDKRMKWEQRQKERAERDAEVGEEAGAEGAPEKERLESVPFAAEILTLEQLLTYLRKFTATNSEAKVEEKKEVEVPQGMKIMKKKDDLNADFMPVAKRAPKGKAAAAPPPAKEPSAPAGPKKLSHTLELLQTFMKFGVDVPNTAADIPTTVEKVEAKRAEFEKKKKDKMEKAAKGIKEPTPAEEAEEPAEEAEEPAEEVGEPAEEVEETAGEAEETAGEAEETAGEAEETAGEAEETAGEAEEVEQPAPAEEVAPAKVEETPEAPATTAEEA